MTCNGKYGGEVRSADGEDWTPGARIEVQAGEKVEEQFDFMIARDLGVLGLSNLEAKVNDAENSKLLSTFS